MRVCVCVCSWIGVCVDGSGPKGARLSVCSSSASCHVYALWEYAYALIVLADRKRKLNLPQLAACAQIRQEAQDNIPLSESERMQQAASNPTTELI